MTLGSVELADGSHVPGFLCEPSALADAEDITWYGGWRSYRDRRDEQLPGDPSRHPTDE